MHLSCGLTKTLCWFKTHRICCALLIQSAEVLQLDTLPWNSHHILTRLTTPHKYRWASKIANWVEPVVELRVERTVERRAIRCLHLSPLTTLTPLPPLEWNFFTLSSIWSKQGYKMMPGDARRRSYVGRKTPLASQRCYRCSPLPPPNLTPQARARLHRCPQGCRRLQLAHPRVRQCLPLKRRSPRIHFLFVLMQPFKFFLWMATPLG